MPARLWRHVLTRLLLYALLALVLIALVFPVLFMLLTSLKTGNEFARVPPTLFPHEATLTAGWTAAGICAHESAMQGGARVEIPQYGHEKSFNFRV